MGIESSAVGGYLMSIEQMRGILSRVYVSQFWKAKVNKMSDKQVYAVYMRFLEDGKLKGVK